MSHIAPVKSEEIPEQLEPMFEMARGAMGFLPNSMPTMAHWPELSATLGSMAMTILRTGELDMGLKQMIAAVVSGAAGCRYCQAHTTHSAAHGGGIDEEKIAEIWSYQQSDLFTDAEKAALDLALAAGQVPNVASDVHFAALKQHYSDRQIIEIVAVISLFGFLNRWNDTLATELEEEPLSFARSLYSPKDWAPSKHVG